MRRLRVGWPTRATTALVGLALTALTAPLVASSSAVSADPRSPYAGLEQRSIKALSTEQIGDLLTGRGMGLALAAELNGYPGPTHVLDLAEELSLTPDQAARAEALRAEMSEAAAELGAEIVRREAMLDALFASGAAELEALHRQVSDLARLQGELRFTHLRAHLAMRALLTPEQNAAYARLRGYGGPAPADHHRGGHDTH